MLIGKLISLGPVIPADFPALFRWGNDVDSARVNEVYRPSDWNSHQEWWSNIGKDPSKVVFAIRKQGSNNIIGYVQIMNISGIHQSAHLTVRIGEASDRGHGYGREATCLAIEYCWNHLNIGRIGLTVFKTHERALKVYSSLGFETEGLLRRAFFIDGQWVDVVLMSMLHPSRVNRRQTEAYGNPSDAAAPPSRTEGFHKATAGRESNAGCGIAAPDSAIRLPTLIGRARRTTLGSRRGTKTSYARPPDRSTPPESAAISAAGGRLQ